jgi:riboflavin synthase
MFTGIIESTGKVVNVTPHGGGATLRIDAGPVATGLAPGASLAVNGACLTASHVDGSCLTFDVIKETVTRSTLGRLRPGDRVNLERSLAVGSRLDGHFVQGHVDGLARLVRRVAKDDEFVLGFAPEPALLTCIIPQGSIAVDGVSLTVAEVGGAEFSVALTPTTLGWTTLGERRIGDVVNVETDILVRTIVHALGGVRGAGGVTLEKLSEHGFL